MGSASRTKNTALTDGSKFWYCSLEGKTVPKCRESAVRKLLWKPLIVCSGIAWKLYSMTAHPLMRAHFIFLRWWPLFWKNVFGAICLSAVSNMMEIYPCYCPLENEIAWWGPRCLHISTMENCLMRLLDEDHGAFIKTVPPSWLCALMRFCCLFLLQLPPTNRAILLVAQWMRFCCFIFPALRFSFCGSGINVCTCVFCLRCAKNLEFCLYLRFVRVLVDLFIACIMQRLHTSALGSGYETWSLIIALSYTTNVWLITYPNACIYIIWVLEFEA